jgi:hypothetical protein
VKKRFAALLMLLMLFISGCAQFPVTDEVKIEFTTDRDVAIVTAETTFQLRPGSEEARKRIDTARAAVQSNTDPWSLRFSRLHPEVERVTHQTRGGVLESVTRVATIPDEELQQVFSDTSVTVEMVHGDGWRELRLYPGTSARATRDQQRRFAAELASWSTLVARYFTAVNRLYSYMNENPGRAQYLFAALMNEKREDGSPAVVKEEEQPLIDDVEHAMDDVGARMDEQEGRAATFAEEADLAYNPFPARVTISVPGDVLSTEGFNAPKDRTLVIEPINLFATIAGLEGKWISPDPLAAALREQQLTSQELAALPRRSAAFVPATSVADAIREQLARPKAYVVRWRD